MALIYASAVNRRMNALQKKNSTDITSSINSQNNSELFQHFKQRSNEDNSFDNNNLNNNENNGGIIEKNIYRKMSNTKSNLNPTQLTNGNDVGGNTNNNNKAAALLQFQQQLLIQQQQNNQNNNKKGNQSRDQLAALFNRFVIDDSLSTSRCRTRRKISTPIMAQSMTASIYANMTGEKGGNGRRNSKKSSKQNSPISPNNDSKGHFFAKIGKSIRRRSVSADETIFRKRNGTNSSIDSSQGGEGCSSPITRSRKSSALNRMKERLNKWKISG